MSSESASPRGGPGIRIRAMTTPAEFEAGDQLQRRVWRIEEGSTPVPAEVLNAISHAGGYVAGAFRADALVGLSTAWLGRDEGTGRIFLWEHVLAAQSRDAGVGHALKLEQAAWCAARGIDEVRWTFDPLVSRNAYFALGKLGATVLSYTPDFYGPLDDGINLADESDRLVASWAVDRALGSRSDGLSASDLRGGHPLLSIDEHGGPRLHAVVGDGTASSLGGLRTCAVPPDIEALRLRDPKLAAGWRKALRECLLDELAAEGAIVGFARSGHYLLSGKQV